MSDFQICIIATVLTKGLSVVSGTVLVWIGYLMYSRGFVNPVEVNGKTSRWRVAFIGAPGAILLILGSGTNLVTANRGVRFDYEKTFESLPATMAGKDAFEVGVIPTTRGTPPAARVEPRACLVSDEQPAEPRPTQPATGVVSVSDVLSAIVADLEATKLKVASLEAKVASLEAKVASHATSGSESSAIRKLLDQYLGQPRSSVKSKIKHRTEGHEDPDAIEVGPIEIPTIGNDYPLILPRKPWDIHRWKSGDIRWPIFDSFPGKKPDILN